jgi:N-acetylmuramoyl-L-alanine amidase
MKRLLLCFLVVSVGLFSAPILAQSSLVKKVVLDAGHGGKDPGNLGTGRYKETEKQIALAVTLKVGKYIEDNLPDVEVIYTRKDDSFPTLWDRANLANDENADLFISIHCDAFDKQSAHGCGSYIMGLDYTDENLRVAQKENSVIFLEDNYEEHYDGFDPKSIESIIALTLNQSVYMDKSILIAQKIQNQFKTRVNRTDRGVRQAPYLVTSRTLMPSVLVELGFLTNPEEEDFLRSEKGKTYMASAIYRAFKEYKLEIEKEVNPIVSEEVVRVNDKKGAMQAEKINILHDKDINKDLIFRVQIAASPIAEDKGSLGDYSIESYQDGSLYKYTIGNETNLDNAKELQSFARKNGYKDAFLIAFWKGEKMSVLKALEQQKKEKDE